MRNVTVVIPQSPIKSHPGTGIIDETLESIRVHLPDSEIIMTFDGVRKEQNHYATAYSDYKNTMLWRCLHEWNDVVPFVFEEVQHQSGMMKHILPEIKTDFILYVEQDTPLAPDRVIDWERCAQMLYEGEANTIRYHFEEVIPKEHKSLMLSEHNDFIRTIQWSQRPHLSTKVYYEYMMSHFPDDAQSFIEDYWYGIVKRDYDRDGMLGWYKHRLWIYALKDSLGIKRSYTTDGRAGDPKFGEGF